MTKKQEERNDSIAYLLKTFSPSDTLGVLITSVSRSGMSRRMRVYAPGFRDITYHVAKVCELSENKKGILVTGCGMDMTFWLIDHLTYCLYTTKPKGLKGNGGGCIDWTIL